MRARWKGARDAQQIFPKLKPTRASTYAQTSDRKGVLVACHDENVCLVVTHPTDLFRLKATIEAAIQAQSE